MAYKIHIDEGQRAYIVAALQAYEAQHGIPGDGHPGEYLVKMLVDTPEIDRDHPGVLHGLCL